MKKLFILFVSVLVTTTAFPQSENFFGKLKGQMKEHNVFQHLDASLSLGTTGVGIDVSSPIGEYVELRAGYSFMPRFHHNMTFGVQVGDDPSKSESKFQRLSGLLESFTGYKVDNEIDMIGVPTLHNFNMLVDVFPFKENRHWHFTAGFYWGPSKIAKAYNTTEDMPSLMAVGIYNNLYDKVKNGEAIYNDTYLSFEMEEKILSYGRMGIHIGDFKETGEPYMMEPDENSMAKAKVMVNAFKPYLGFGYGGRLLKGNDKYKISFDCGMMFWGGTPSIITHDGTDMAKDVENIGGKVGDYVDLLKAFKVFPVLNVRFTKSLF